MSFSGAELAYGSDSGWKLLLVGNDRRKHFFLRLTEEAAQLGFQVTIVGYHEFDLVFDGDAQSCLKVGNLPINTVADAVMMDSPGLHYVMRDLVVNCLMEQGILLLNGNSYARWSSMNKLLQAHVLQRAGVPIVPTRCMGAPSRLLDLVSKLQDPAIIKWVFGTEGNQVYRVESDLELLTILRRHDVQNLLVQPLVQNAEEYRVVVLGNRSLGAVRKLAAKGEFRANLAQGAKHEAAVLPGVVEEVAIRSCEVLQCDFAGVDILCDDDQNCWVLEVNRVFNYRGFEQATQRNVAVSLLSWMNTKLNLGNAH